MQEERVFLQKKENRMCGKYVFFDKKKKKNTFLAKKLA